MTGAIDGRATRVGTASAAARVRRFLIVRATVTLTGFLCLVVFVTTQLGRIEDRIAASNSHWDTAIVADEAERVVDRAEIALRTAIGSGDRSVIADAAIVVERAERAHDVLVEVVEAGVPEESAASFSRMRADTEDLLDALRRAAALAASGDGADALLSAEVAERSAVAHESSLAFTSSIAETARNAADDVRAENDRTQRLLAALAVFAFLGAALNVTAATRGANAIVGEAEAYLAASRTEADQALRFRNELLASVSHEFRTPLNGLIGMLSLLDRSELSEEAAEALTVARRCASDLHVMVEDVLHLARLDAEQACPTLESVDPARIVLDVAQQFTAFAHEQGDTIRTFVRTPDDLAVALDPTRVRRALAGLVENAVKFTRGGTVTLEVCAVTTNGAVTTLEFSVDDTGTGVDPAIREHLFDHFVQGDHQSRTQTRGAGVGLTICKRLVESMNGSIGYSSEPGRGSRFWFRLPVEPTSRPDTVGSTVAGTARSLHVLVAEDNAVNQLLVTRYLERLGHSAVVVTDGRQAVDALDHDVFDVVLMDIQMPVMDGTEATQLIRSRRDRWADIPVIALTARLMPDDIDSYLAIGMSDCLAKPFALDELETVLRAVTDASADTDRSVRRSDLRWST